MALVSLLLRCCSIEDRRLPLSLSLSRSSRVSSSTPVVRRNVCACSRDCSCLPAAAAVLPLPSRSYPLTRRTRASDCQRRCRPDIIFDSSLTLALLVLKEREKSSNTHDKIHPPPFLLTTWQTRHLDAASQQQQRRQQQEKEEEEGEEGRQVTRRRLQRKRQEEEDS